MNKFHWGETVVIRNDIPKHLHPGEIASICSVMKLTSEDVKKNPELKEPSWLYTVEFGDGSAIDLSECYLEHFDNPSRKK